MAHLSLSLLGPFAIELDGQPVTGLKSNKVRALLAYLAVEADRVQRREVLAGLLWPDWPDRDALGNLRSALSNLRRAIGDREADPPFLLISRDSLQFNLASDFALDVATFTKLAEVDEPGRDTIDRLEQAVSLYQGAFLEGFSLGDCSTFEEWASFTRERLARQMSSALHHLADACEQRGEYEQAQSFAWRQIELEPWDEVAHQKLMRALALGGRRSAALAQYESCRQLLAEELGVDPAAETRRLYELIRDGELEARSPAEHGRPGAVVERPSFLDQADEPEVEGALFVAREREMAQLERSFDQVLAGQSRTVFVTGEAGSGKTSLIQEFARRALQANANLIVASGNCNAYTGVGDPYLPFREILELLTGGVEAKWEAQAINREHAHRLWDTLPAAVQALVSVGPDLIDTLISHEALLARAAAHGPGRPDWLVRLQELVERKLAPSVPSPQQSDLLEQYTRVLQALSGHTPLVLVVDDLQWADVGSIGLLFHLGRQLGGSSVLIVGAYRPEEVALGRDGARHPLEPVVNEFQREFGDIMVNIDQAEGQDFLDALLDDELNRLGPSFRERLFRQTRGHPLFAVELLRGMRECGDLVQDSEGFWVEGEELAWETLPARVEGAIAERVGRLPEPLQTVLRVASVEGENFTAEVAARVMGSDEREMVSHLSSELVRQHRLVRAQGIERLGSQRVSRYRFRHYLIQKFLYDSLDDVERAHLHEEVGNALEVLYRDAANEMAAVAPQLAWHFQEAGIAEKAIQYLHKAGERAVEVSAYSEGRTHLTKGLELLKSLPDTEDKDQRLRRDRLELALQLGLGIAWLAMPGAVIESGRAYSRARELCLQMGETLQLCQIVGQMAMLHYVRGEYGLAHELAEEEFELAQRAGDALLVSVNHWHLGFILFCQGEFTLARTHLEHTIAAYEPEQHADLVFLTGSDAGLSALAYDACCLWCLGYPDQAMLRAEEALAQARGVNHPFTLADVLAFAGVVISAIRRDGRALRDAAEELIALADEKGMPTWSTLGVSHLGAGLIMLGQIREGMQLIRDGIAESRTLAVGTQVTRALCALAEAQAELGRPDEGLATLAEALALLEQTGEFLWESELKRVNGELLLRQGDESGAEASFQEAIEAARCLQARSFELRAAVALARLWQGQGRIDNARGMLTEIYEWFSEGFDTPDLQAAGALLAELSS